MSDANAIFDRLREAGVSLRSKPTTIDEPGPWLGARAFYASDPDGVTVELIEQAESFWPDLARPDRDERA